MSEAGTPRAPNPSASTSTGSGGATVAKAGSGGSATHCLSLGLSPSQIVVVLGSGYGGNEMPNRPVHMAQLAIGNEIGVPNGGSVSLTLMTSPAPADAVTATTWPA